MVGLIGGSPIRKIGLIGAAVLVPAAEMRVGIGVIDRLLLAEGSLR